MDEKTAFGILSISDIGEAELPEDFLAFAGAKVLVFDGIHDSIEISPDIQCLEREISPEAIAKVMEELDF